MIFNFSQGGAAYLNVTAPAGASISASITGESVSGSGTCLLEIHTIGTWSISCTIAGVTKTVNVGVTSYGQTTNLQFSKITVSAPGGTITCDDVSRSGSGDIPVYGTGNKTVTCVYDSTTHTNTVSIASGTTSYSTTFTYSCTISVSCPAGAYVVASRSGYSNVTRTGPGTLSVPKYGNWTVTAYIGSGRGATSKAATVSAVYDNSVSCSVYPRLYIYLYNDGSGHYYGAGDGLTFEKTAGASAEYDVDDDYGAWTMAGLRSWNTGNNFLRTTNLVDLTGYDKMYMKLRYADGASIIWGLSSSGNKWAAESWERRQTIRSGGQYDRADSPGYPSFYTQTFDFANANASLYPIIRNLGGLSDTVPPGSSHVMIMEWYLE